MPSSQLNIAFCPVEREHYALLREWLNQPHILEWWGDPEEELGFIRDMVEGRDTTRPFLFTVDGAPIGYIQYWFIGHHQNEEWIKDNPWLADLPSDAVGVDVSVGDPSLLSQGYGSAAVKAFAVQLLEEGHSTIVIDPDRGNHRAVRAYEKAGFRTIQHLDGRTGDVLLMQFDPNSKETL
jgi:RimJ/RimL family protein N-acetyltransferase